MNLMVVVLKLFLTITITFMLQFDEFVVIVL